MQKITINQSLSQKLSPQQIQFIKLLQVPTAELETRIEEELEANPVLEEGIEEDNINTDAPETESLSDDDNYEDESETFDLDDEQLTSEPENISVDEYLQDEDGGGYKMQGDGGGEPEEERESFISTITSLSELLNTQLGFLRLSEKEEIIGKQLIGSIESDGYIRRDLRAIANDLVFSQNVETNEAEIEAVLMKVQTLDPPGIAARDLKECLILQLYRKREEAIHSPEEISHAVDILDECFLEFTKKHYDKIQKKLNITDEELKEAIALITKLNPKPGEVSGGNYGANQYIIPDFILMHNNGKLDLMLNGKNAPELRINRSYAEMLDTYDKSDKKDKLVRETVSFVKQKLDAAKWFIDAIKQRQHTLLRTMNAILQYQYDFFLEGDESKLRPMILKDIAEQIEMDISTVSRVANSKSIQTEFGIFPLKYFFSEGIATDSGEDVSSREVKHILKELIENEQKGKPLSDDKLEKLLKDKGYNIARRTVAKYREQLNIPVARLRKEL